MAALIEDYGLIGDLQTAALVSRSGSIDWLCFPRFDSGACFAALLGEDDNGRWELAPEAPVTGSSRATGRPRSTISTGDPLFTLSMRALRLFLASVMLAFFIEP